MIDAGAKGAPEILNRTIALGETEMARLLLDHGVATDVAKPLENRNSVYWAVSYHRPEILKLLLAHGADPEMKTAYDETPLSVAQKFHQDLVPILEKAIRSAARRRPRPPIRPGRRW